MKDSLFTSNINFKKPSYLVLLLCLILGLSACSSNNNQAQQPDKKEKTSVEVSHNNKAAEETASSANSAGEKSAQEQNHPNIKGIAATVYRVVDGDTVDVKLKNGKEERVRLILVDTPETKHPRLGVQPFGKKASAFTTSQLTGKEVVLEKDVEERDRYGRLLAYVWVDGKLYNQILVEKGLARVAVFPPNTKYVDQFRRVQDKARKAGIGIWSIENYAQEDGYHTNSNNSSTQSSSSTAARKTPSSSYANSGTSSGGSFENNPSDDKETNTSCSGKIKGNANSKIYHVPGGQYYESTKDNIVWFCSEADAQSAGYRASKR